MKIVIRCDGGDAALAAPSERADVDGRFGINRNPEPPSIRISHAIDGGYVGEDGIGLGNFFGGRLFATVCGS